ncbi:hypothetical protein, partial [Bifidobacterium pseudocatenulatum]
YERYYLCKMAELFCFEDGTPSFHWGKGGLYSRVLTRVPMGKLRYDSEPSCLGNIGGGKNG